MTTTTPARKRAVKKVVSEEKAATPRKRTTKATTNNPSAEKREAVPSASPTRGPNVVKGWHGFAVNTDSAIIAEELVRGGLNMLEIRERVTERIKATSGMVTATGREKTIAATIGSVLAKMQSRGYIVESTYRLLCPPDIKVPAEFGGKKAVAKPDAVIPPQRRQNRTTTPKTTPSAPDSAPKARSARGTAKATTTVKRATSGDSGASTAPATASKVPAKRATAKTAATPAKKAPAKKTAVKRTAKNVG